MALTTPVRSATAEHGSDRNRRLRALTRTPIAGILITATAALLGSGCAPLKPATPVDLARADQGRWGPVQVVVYKNDRKMIVYRRGVPFRQYPVRLGFKPEGDKRYQHDARTPEGRYSIVGKRRHARWQHFLAVDYPNDDDRKRYRAARAAGTIPVLDGQPLGIGGSIGIHGTDKPTTHVEGIDWTKGCIAMTADDIAELEDIVVVGTPLWVLE